jgi:hypothetical protein
MCARALAKHPVVVYCAGIPKAELEAMFFRPGETPQAAVDTALQMKEDGCRVLVLPYAVDCVPKINPV